MTNKLPINLGSGPGSEKLASLLLVSAPHPQLSFICKFTLNTRLSINNTYDFYRLHHLLHSHPQAFIVCDFAFAFVYASFLALLSVTTASQSLGR